MNDFGSPSKKFVGAARRFQMSVEVDELAGEFIREFCTARTAVALALQG